MRFTLRGLLHSLGASVSTLPIFVIPFLRHYAAAHPSSSPFRPHLWHADNSWLEFQPRRAGARCGVWPRLLLPPWHNVSKVWWYAWPTFHVTCTFVLPLIFWVSFVHSPSFLKPCPPVCFPHRSCQGFMHMKFTHLKDGKYVLGQNSPPFDTIPEVIHFYTTHKLPIRGAEHLSLLFPVLVQTLWLSRTLFWTLALELWWRR